MLSSIFVATIGNRDLLYNSEQIRPARVEAEKLLHLCDKEPDKFEMPILMPALKQAIEETSVKQIFLIATDQPEFTEEKYRRNDTIYFAQIIKKLLDNHWKKLGFNVKPFEKVVIIRIKTNPNFLSKLLGDLHHLITQKLNTARKNGAKKLYLCITGGIPTLNAAIMLLANKTYKLDLNLIRVDDGIAYPDQVAQELEKIELNNFIETLIESWNFKHIYLRLEETNISDKLLKQIHTLCKAMSARLIFNFSDSLALLKSEFAQSEPAFAESFKVLIQELNKLANIENETEGRKLLIKELILNIIFKFKQKEFVDVSGRLFRLLEEISIQILEIIIGKPINFSENEKNFPEFTNFIKTNNKLKEFFISKEIDYSRLNLYSAEQTFIYLLNSNHKHKELIAKFLKIYNQLHTLKQLRNKSIIAHGFKSIKETDFPDNFLSLVNDMGELVEVTNPDKSVLLLTSSIKNSLQ